MCSTHRCFLHVAALKEEADLHRRESSRLNEELYLQVKPPLCTLLDSLLCTWLDSLLRSTLYIVRLATVYIVRLTAVYIVRLTAVYIVSLATVYIVDAPLCISSLAATLHIVGRYCVHC